MGMHDGFETKRSRGRDPNNSDGTGCEGLLVALGTVEESRSAGAHVLAVIEADFSYFVNNNPVAMEIWGFTEMSDDA